MYSHVFLRTLPPFNNYPWVYTYRYTVYTRAEKRRPSTSRDRLNSWDVQTWLCEELGILKLRMIDNHLLETKHWNFETVPVIIHVFDDFPSSKPPWRRKLPERHFPSQSVNGLGIMILSCDRLHSSKSTMTQTTALWLTGGREWGNGMIVDIIYI